MPASATASRRQKEKEDRRGAILAAAREVFFSQGLRRATVDEIAARAAVAKGTVYLYFESREVLLASLLLEGLDILNDRLERAFAETADYSAETRLRRLADAYLDFYQTQRDYFHLMMAFDRGQFREAISPEMYERILMRSVRSLRWVVRAIQQGRDSGELPVADPKPTAGMVWAALNGALVLSSHPLRRELLEQEVESLYAGVLEMMLAGLKTAPLRPTRRPKSTQPKIKGGPK